MYMLIVIDVYDDIHDDKDGVNEKATLCMLARCVSVFVLLRACYDGSNDGSNVWY